MPKASSSKTTARSTSSSPSKSPRTPSKSKADVEPVDESLWPKSTLHSSTMINKTAAKQLYRLKDEDLTGLKVEESETVVTINGERVVKTMFLYSEREVERVAWRKHGGPAGWKAELDKLKERYDKMQEKKAPAQRKPFPAPSSYTTRGSFPMIVAFKMPMPTLEERWTSTPALLRLKQRFVPWVWRAVVEHLERREDAMTVDDMPFSGPNWSDNHKERMVELALKWLHYPERPAQRLPPSSSVDKLREVLKAAPRPRGRDDVAGIALHEDHELNYSAWWADSYLQKLFPALVDVILEHGVGDDGWQTVRWEVYEKYTECLGAIRYIEDGHYSRWIDNASRWLCGRTEHPLAGDHDRISKLGDEYNALLPFTDPYGRI